MGIELGPRVSPERLSMPPVLSLHTSFFARLPTALLKSREEEGQWQASISDYGWHGTDGELNWA